MEKTIDKMNELLKKMRETIPTNWEYGHTYFADALYKDLKFEIELAKNKQFVIADGHLVKIIYHIDKQVTEFEISYSFSRELDRNLLDSYKSLCKQLNDFLKVLQGEIEKS